MAGVAEIALAFADLFSILLTLSDEMRELDTEKVQEHLEVIARFEHAWLALGRGTKSMTIKLNVPDTDREIIGLGMLRAALERCKERDGVALDCRSSVADAARSCMREFEGRAPFGTPWHLIDGWSTRTAKT